MPSSSASTTSSRMPSTELRRPGGTHPNPSEPRTKPTSTVGPASATTIAAATRRNVMPASTTSGSRTRAAVQRDGATLVRAPDATEQEVAREHRGVRGCVRPHAHADRGEDPLGSFVDDPARRRDQRRGDRADRDGREDAEHRLEPIERIDAPVQQTSERTHRHDDDIQRCPSSRPGRVRRRRRTARSTSPRRRRARRPGAEPREARRRPRGW